MESRSIRRQTRKILQSSDWLRASRPFRRSPRLPGARRVVFVRSGLCAKAALLPLPSQSSVLSVFFPGLAASGQSLSAVPCPLRQVSPLTSDPPSISPSVAVVSFPATRCRGFVSVNRAACRHLFLAPSPPKIKKSIFPGPRWRVRARRDNVLCVRQGEAGIAQDLLSGPCRLERSCPLGAVSATPQPWRAALRSVCSSSTVS